MYMSKQPETKDAKIRRRQLRDLPNRNSSTSTEMFRQMEHEQSRGRKKPLASSMPTGTGKYVAAQRRKLLPWNQNG